MNNHITRHPDILGGRPIIADTHMSVEQILGLLANGMTQKEIIKHYPPLTEDSIKAALEFAQRAIEKEFPVDKPDQHTSKQVETVKNPMARRILEAIDKSHEVTMEDAEVLLKVIKKNQMPLKFDSPFDEHEDR